MTTRSQPAAPTDDTASRADARAERLREIAPYLARWLAVQVEQRGAPGVQVAIRHRGELILSEAVGSADLTTGTALTTDHLFRVASHSKTFAAVLVLQLVEQGRLRLDDTVGTLLPSYARTPLATATVRELLSHTSGAIRDGADTDHWQLDRPFPDAAALQEWVAESGAVFAPLEHFKYSNIGYGIIGAIIEAISGESFTDRLRHAIADPLGLASTAGDLTDELAPRTVTGHSWPHGPGRERVAIDHLTTGALAAAGGVVSSAEELSAFYSALAPGSSPLLTDRTLRAMHRPESTFERAGGTVSYGLGTIGIQVGGTRYVGHSGGFPGHITRTLLDTESGLVVTVLTNAVDGPAEPIALGLIELIDLLSADPAAWQQLPDGVSRTDLERFTGRWFSLWGITDIIRAGDRLVSLDPRAPQPRLAVTELRAADAQTLFPEKEDSFADVGEPITLATGSDGAVTLREGGGTLWREEEYLARRGDRWVAAEGVEVPGR